ncbi:MAG: DNA-processing protein DprA [Spirochaetaceae bacterium]|jgi:DNA processing protein|nr:DNA-processing protein DprA [Spirochaetaceae bacterium]
MEKTLLALVVDQLGQMNLKNKNKLLHDLNSLEDLNLLTKDKLRNHYSWRGDNLSWSKMLTLAEAMVKYCRNNRITLALQGQDSYPELLEQVYDPPLILFIRGRIPSRDFSGAAVVGTRRPSGDGINQAFQVGLDLALRECPLVSGLALGIDGAAHKGALAGWGWTLAVLASGVDRIYPLEHRGLARDILNNGGSLISEYPPGTEPTRYRYPMRNRIISGLASVSVVIQAPQRSGALITADYALQEGRDLVVGTSGLQAAGTMNLAEQGAPVISRGRDLVTLLGVDTEEIPGQQCEKPRSICQLINLTKEEIQGDILPYGGHHYHGL